ncbi:MAG: hypothetical protein NT089_05675 [Planctomycetia bacterium]|nr:hypothetical protein [Planctomycetia bacterium]
MRCYLPSWPLPSWAATRVLLLATVATVVPSATVVKSATVKGTEGIRKTVATAKKLLLAAKNLLLAAARFPAVQVVLVAARL